MAEWKTQLSYNYNPPYHHAYAYGIVYQAGSEQTQGTLPSWADHGVAELGSYNAVVPQGYYATTARPREESPPRSPEQSVLNLHGHYQSSGVVYLGGSQNSRIGFPGQPPSTYDPLVIDDGAGRARSGTPTSDSEAHTSPDSWSSPSSREEGLPQTDPTAWIKKELDHDPETGSPNTTHDLSSILEEPQSFDAVENEDPNTSCSPVATSKTTPTPKTRRTTFGRGKRRTAFSEEQMNALVQRFSAQRYLTPAEMKNLAAQSGLTYKQVKTWFQNRRMKLRRHQKDTSWVSEHYNTKKAVNVNPGPAVYPNMAPLLQQYQGDARSHLQEQYTQHMMEAGGVYKNTAPQNLAYYLAAMGAAGTASYHGSWSTGGPRTNPLPSRPEGHGWPMASSAHQQQQYDYSNPSAYSASGPLATSDDSTANSDGRLDCPLHMALGQGTDDNLPGTGIC
ncbi:unnamed protein product [Arctogadus glacialis]